MQHPSSISQTRQQYAVATDYTHTVVWTNALWLTFGLTMLPIGVLIALGVVGDGVRDIGTLLPAIGTGVAFALLKAVVRTILAGAITVIIARHAFTWIPQTVATARDARARAELLDQQGAVVPGVIIDRWTEERSTSEGPMEVWYVAYQYHTFILKQEVSSTIYHQCGIGMPVSVRYLPSYPLIGRLETVPRPAP